MQKRMILTLGIIVIFTLIGFAIIKCDKTRNTCNYINTSRFIQLHDRYKINDYEYDVLLDSKTSNIYLIDIHGTLTPLYDDKGIIMTEHKYNVTKYDK